jgi:hypothetical protein
MKMVLRGDTMYFQGKLFFRFRSMQTTTTTTTITTTNNNKSLGSRATYI